MTSTWSFGRMKPPAPVSGEISVETARMPDGRIAAMKPEPLALISLASRIGSPAENGARAIEPASSLMASGWSLLRMKFALAAAAGQVCQRRSWRRSTVPDADVGLGDQHVDGFELGDRRGRRFGRLLVDRAGEQRGNAAGGEGDDKHNDTRGFHTLHFPR